MLSLDANQGLANRELNHALTGKKQRSPASSSNETTVSTTARGKSHAHKFWLTLRARATVLDRCAGPRSPARRTSILVPYEECAVTRATCSMAHSRDAVKCLNTGSRTCSIGVHADGTFVIYHCTAGDLRKVPAHFTRDDREEFVAIAARSATEHANSFAICALGSQTFLTAKKIARDTA